MKYPQSTRETIARSGEPNINEDVLMMMMMIDDLMRKVHCCSRQPPNLQSSVSYLIFNKG
jgi:hypothetical protein